MASTPNWDSWLESVWGPETDDSTIPLAIIEAASNVVVGSNQFYGIQDFFSFLPAFAGPTVSVPNVTTTIGDDVVVTGAAPPAGLAPTNPVADATDDSIPDGTLIVSIAGNNITLSEDATESGTIILTVWNQCPFPIAVVTAYIALATACLVQNRWQEQWPIAMAWFVAHYLTLYARAAGNPNSTLGQLAASGLAFGIQVSKAVGDVSTSYQAVQGIENFAAWNLTVWGQLLATQAKVVGAGPLFLY
jgi:hypothetical protein